MTNEQRDELLALGLRLAMDGVEHKSSYEDGFFKSTLMLGSEYFFYSNSYPHFYNTLRSFANEVHLSEDTVLTVAKNLGWRRPLAIDFTFVNPPNWETSDIDPYPRVNNDIQGVSSNNNLMFHEGTNICSMEKEGTNPSDNLVRLRPNPGFARWAGTDN